MVKERDVFRMKVLKKTKKFLKFVIEQPVSGKNLAIARIRGEGFVQQLEKSMGIVDKGSKYRVIFREIKGAEE